MKKYKSCMTSMTYGKIMVISFVRLKEIMLILVIVLFLMIIAKLKKCADNTVMGPALVIHQ